MTASSTSPVPAETQRGVTPRWATVAGTFFYVGRIKPGPGTWAATITMLLWWPVMAAIAPAGRIPVAIVAAVLVSAVGVWSGTAIVRTTGIKDPCWVVIDEVAGQLIALVAAPLNWKVFIAALVLFRFFDILKPPPLRRLERFPEGVGIMLDDVGAGLYSLAVLQLLVRVGVFR